MPRQIGLSRVQWCDEPIYSTLGQIPLFYPERIQLRCLALQYYQDHLHHYEKGFVREFAAFVEFGLGPPYLPHYTAFGRLVQQAFLPFDLENCAT